MLDVVTWTLDPILLEWKGLRVGWYSILFAFGLIVFGYAIVSKMWRREKLPEDWLTALFYYVVIGTIVGARLGHCLFYQPEYYLANPSEILKVWHGGLASHGGVLGIMIAIYIYSRHVTHRSMLWTFDRLCVPVGLVAGMIRLGNLCNHEIYGHTTDVPWAFRFITNIGEWRAGAEPIFSAPSHPTQIYEAAFYFLVFGLMLWLYWRRDAQKHVGLMFGITMVLIFTFRFFIEYLKNDQVPDEAMTGIGIAKWLAIPSVLVSIGFIVALLLKGKKYRTPILWVVGVSLHMIFFGILYLLHRPETLAAVSQALNIGQWLSIPIVLLGLWSIWYSLTCKRPADGRIV